LLATKRGPSCRPRGRARSSPGGSSRYPQPVGMGSHHIDKLFGGIRTAGKRPVPIALNFAREVSETHTSPRASEHCLDYRHHGGTSCLAGTLVNPRNLFQLGGHFRTTHQRDGHFCDVARRRSCKSGGRPADPDCGGTLGLIGRLGNSSVFFRPRSSHSDIGFLSFAPRFSLFLPLCRHVTPLQASIIYPRWFSRRKPRYRVQHL